MRGRGLQTGVACQDMQWVVIVLNGLQLADSRQLHAGGIIAIDGTGIAEVIAGKSRRGKIKIPVPLPGARDEVPLQVGVLNELAAHDIMQGLTRGLKVHPDLLCHQVRPVLAAQAVYGEIIFAVAFVIGVLQGLIPVKAEAVTDRQLCLEPQRLGVVKTGVGGEVMGIVLFSLVGGVGAAEAAVGAEETVERIQVAAGSVVLFGEAAEQGKYPVFLFPAGPAPHHGPLRNPAVHIRPGLFQATVDQGIVKQAVSRRRVLIMPLPVHSAEIQVQRRKGVRGEEPGNGHRLLVQAVCRTALLVLLIDGIRQNLFGEAGGDRPGIQLAGLEVSDRVFLPVVPVVGIVERRAHHPGDTRPRGGAQGVAHAAAQRDTRSQVSHGAVKNRLAVVGALGDGCELPFVPKGSQQGIVIIIPGGIGSGLEVPERPSLTIILQREVQGLYPLSVVDTRKFRAGALLVQHLDFGDHIGVEIAGDQPGVRAEDVFPIHQQLLYPLAVERDASLRVYFQTGQPLQQLFHRGIHLHLYAGGIIFDGIAFDAHGRVAGSDGDGSEGVGMGGRIGWMRDLLSPGDQDSA